MRRAVALAVVWLWAAAAAWAQAPERKPTRIVVRVAANDGKLLADDVGGARVTLSDARSGKLLAEGVQHGNSGDTGKIMSAPHARGAALFDTPGAAAFTADLPLEQPTLVRIRATGPLKYPSSMRTTEKLLLLVPGHDVTGDGVVLQVDGLVVHLNAVTATAGNVDVEAHVAMMCGCPITPGGIWDSGTMSIVAEAWRRRQKVKSLPMRYAGTKSTFRASFSGMPRGKYTVRVVAVTANGANAGQEERPLTVR